ncbi:hypothetical protein DJ73_02140 [Halorubrum sp. Ea1]|nr:hypothetical protein DJ73_02140 [Halorubrum sp. Ea1]
MEIVPSLVSVDPPTSIGIDADGDAPVSVTESGVVVSSPVIVTSALSASCVPPTSISVEKPDVADRESDFDDVSRTPVSVTVSSRGAVVPPMSIGSVSPFVAETLVDAGAVFSTPVTLIE